MIARLYAWVLKSEVARLLSHGLLGAVYVLLWWPIAAVTGLSMHFATAAAFGQYVPRELEDLMKLRTQKQAEGDDIDEGDVVWGFLEAFWPVVMAAIVAQVLQ